MAWEQHSHADGETFTADDMNRMEEAIYDGGGYSSKKEWADQNVPGVEGWNRLENGILAIGSDKVNENLALNTTTMNFTGSAAPASNNTATNLVVNQADSSAPNGFFMSFDSPASTSDASGYYWNSLTRVRNLLGTDNYSKLVLNESEFVFSFWAKATEGSANFNMSQITNQTVLETSSDNALTTEWKRIWCKARFITEDWRLRMYITAHDTDMTVCISALKFELNSLTNWFPAPSDIFTVKTWESEQDENNIINADNANRWEQGITDMLDYREKYATEETETATPQSIPDDTEDDGNVAAPEAEEIE